MRWRRGAAQVLAAVLALGALVATPATRPAEAAPAGDDAVVAFVVRGVGNGHGRGLSQWGAYGRAVAGQSWEDILGTYYGDTQSSTIPVDRRIGVRLNQLVDVGTVGVFSVDGLARWRPDGGAWSATTTSIYTWDRGDGTFDVYTSPNRTCLSAVPDGPLRLGDQGDAVRRMQSFLLEYGPQSPGPVDGDFGPQTEQAVTAFQADRALAADGVWRIEEANAARAIIASAGSAWTKASNTPVPGPIEFALSSAPAEPARQLAVCQPDGTVTHYRGTIRVLDTVDGPRTVNDLPMEEYLRGVVPMEVSASWGDDAQFKGMHALRAQAVAARSYAASQSRAYFVDAAKTVRYATTCDTTSCQAYGGAARRAFPASTVVTLVEHAYTDQAIRETTDGVGARVRVRDGKIVSTEFSASNGPLTADGVGDYPYDDQPGNPLHQWTRVIDADAIATKYGLSDANGVHTEPDPTVDYAGLWDNRVDLGDGSTVSAWDFRNAFGLPSPGFELIPVRRELSGAGTFAFIGDSVGVSITSSPSTHLKDLTEGVFDTAWWSAAVGRSTSQGAAVASQVPLGTDLVVVELGYNDAPSDMPKRIDDVMTALRARDVGRVVWVAVSERRASVDFARTNRALRDATARWSELTVLDWNAASDHAAAARWFSDDVHLTATGRAEFALFLRDAVVEIFSDGYQPPRPLVPGVPLRVKVSGEAGVPVGAAGVALNVTAVRTSGWGFLQVWPCGSGKPSTSSVNFTSARAVEPNAVLVPVDATGEVCVSSSVATDVLVDVSGWFESGLRAASGDLRLVDTRIGKGDDGR